MGTSLGALVAANFAYQYPTKVISLSLLCPPGEWLAGEEEMGGQGGGGDGWPGERDGRVTRWEEEEMGGQGGEMGG